MAWRSGAHKPRSTILLAAVLSLTCLALWSCGQHTSEPQRDNPLDTANPDAQGDPFNLRQVDSDQDAVMLAWDAVPVSGVEQYRLRRWPGMNGQESDSNDLPDTVRWFSDTEIQAGETYLYKIAALDAKEQESDVSDSLVVHVNSAPVVSILSPDDDAAFAVDASITFQGSAPDAEDDSLSGAALVWTSDRAGPFGTGTTVTTSDLESNTHHITLTATDSWGDSGTATITIHIGRPPSAATGPNPSDSAQNVEVTKALSWQGSVDPGGGPVSYDVYLGTNSGPPLVSERQAGTSYDPPDLTAGTQYYWRVVARGGSGGTTSGAEWSFRTLPDGFVFVDPVTFMMGSPTSEVGHDDWGDETQHQVTLTHAFYVQNTEVTNQQYRDMAQWAYDNGYVTATTSGLYDNLDGSTRFLKTLGGADPYGYGENDEITFSAGVFSCTNSTHPVTYMPWYGSVAYCDWLSLKQGLSRAYDHSTWQCNAGYPYTATGYRLPTEAEWEYVCRAGMQTPFSTGSCLDAGTDANYNGGYPYTECPTGPHAGWTVPVGSYTANAFGLFDMHGNLWEWCNDWYGTYGGNVTDPVGAGAGSVRVIRGGSWYNYAQGCRSAVRSYYYPGRSDNGIGFRPVRSTF
jgi:formylglycine-generating enzyme required for sulfatase activity